MPSTYELFKVRQTIDISSNYPGTATAHEKIHSMERCLICAMRCAKYGNEPRDWGSFARIANSVRTAYTLGYISHQPTAGKYRAIGVQVEGRSRLDVRARAGYSPSVPAASSGFNRKIGASEAQARIFPSDR